MRWCGASDPSGRELPVTAGRPVGRGAVGLDPATERPWEGKSRSLRPDRLIRDPDRMLFLVPLLIGGLLRGFPSRRHLIVENLLLRQQLQVALRTRPRLQLRVEDKLFWLLVRA